ncbi:MAG: hypothetical protein FJW68_06240 [Actinobacteria bacterium]|nr:hypothetical protein [Actinomycetota bacterium]
METFLNRVHDFFKIENLSHFWLKIYEWFELTLITLFGKIPYLPIRNLFINPWFWFMLAFVIIIILIFKRR